MTLYVTRPDLDADINRDSEINDDDESLEGDVYPDEDSGEADSLGLVVYPNDDDDIEDETIDNANSTIDGEDDEDDLVDIKLSLPLLAELIDKGLEESHPVKVELIASTGGGSVRIFLEGEEILAPDGTGTADITTQMKNAGDSGITFKMEGVETGQLTLSAVFYAGEQEVARDELPITVLKIEYVVPSSYNEDTGESEGDPTPTDFVGVSDPRPTVVLDAT